MMRKVFAAASLLAGVCAQSVSSCGGPGDHMQNVVVKVSPDPPVKGQPLTLTMSGTLGEDLGAGSVDVDLTVKALGIIDKSIKQSSPFSLTPAFKKGPQSVTVGPFSLPRLPGNVVLKGTVKLVNNKSEPTACVNLNLDMPALEASESASEDVAQGMNCGKPTDHAKNIQVGSSGGALSVAGSLDEAITKATVHVDLKVHEIFNIPVKVDIPITMSPGLPNGDFKLIAGPAKPGDLQVQAPLLSVTGTVTVDDGNNEEICCLRVGGFDDGNVARVIV